MGTVARKQQIHNENFNLRESSTQTDVASDIIYVEVLIQGNISSDGAEFPTPTVTERGTHGKPLEEIPELCSRRVPHVIK